MIGILPFDLLERSLNHDILHTILMPINAITSYVYLRLHYVSLLLFRITENRVCAASYYRPEFSEFSITRTEAP